ncbi:unnamed protein product [Dicrocoelium dendriticum]|nr:unnamed protein product [Dicrocoelium dendriticum]
MNRLNELLKSSLFTKLQLDYADKHSVVSPVLRTSESIERTTSPRLQTLASSMSAAAVEVRQKAVTLTQRALFTRSADVSTVSSQSPPFTRISASINFPAVPAVPDAAALEHLVETGVEVDEANQ